MIPWNDREDESTAELGLGLVLRVRKSGAGWWVSVNDAQRTEPVWSRDDGKRSAVALARTCLTRLLAGLDAAS